MRESRKLVMAVLLSASMAGAVDSQLLNLVMPEAKVLVGINLAAFKGSPIGRTLMSQAQAGAQQFGALGQLGGFDPFRDLQEILIASPGEGRDNTGLVLARSSFDLAKIFEMAKQSGVQVQTYNGVPVFVGKAKEESWGAFLDSSIVAIGDAKTVRALLDRRGAATALDPKLAARAQQLSQQYDFWMISATPPSNFSTGVQDPQLNGIMQGDIFKGILETGGGLKFGPEILFGLEAVARTEKDAASVADVLKFFVGMAQMGAQKDPKAAASAAFLQKLSVHTEGNVMKMTLTIPADEVEKIVQQAIASAKQQAETAARPAPAPRPKATPLPGGVTIYSSPSDMGTVVIK